MSIPKWRLVNYESDGMYAYQCLHCYAYYDGCYCAHNYLYCPHCGIKWEGEHPCLTRDDKFANRPNPKPARFLTLEFQQRTFWRNDGPDLGREYGWECCCEGGTSLRLLRLEESDADDRKRLLPRIREIIDRERNANDTVFGSEFRLVLMDTPAWRTYADSAKVIKVIKEWIV